MSLRKDYKRFLKGKRGYCTSYEIIKNNNFTAKFLNKIIILESIFTNNYIHLLE